MSEKIISSESVQGLCDLLLVHPSKEHVPNFLEDKKKFFSKITENYNNPPIVFTYTDSFEKVYYALISVLKKFQNNFILVVNNSDYKIDYRYVNIFKIVKKLQLIYAVNVDVSHPKIVPIPIGFGSTCYPHGNLDVITNCINTLQNIKKHNLVYFNFTIKNNIQKRLECFEKVSQKGIPFLPNTDFKNYMETLSNYKFCISPEGNGIDCHRFWESLYLRVIPICLQNTVVNYFSKFFPVLILNDWSELDLSKLEEIYINADWSNIEKFNLDVIKQMFTNKLTEYPLTSLL